MAKRLGGGRRPTVLVLDASLRQALVATRSLGRAGVAVVTAEADDVERSALGTPAASSRWSVRNAVLPSYHAEASDYSSAVLDLAAAQEARAVIPSSDGSIASLGKSRSIFDRRGVALAMSSESALATANDKYLTTRLAIDLGLPVPRTAQIPSGNDLDAALKEVGCSAVIKPTRSWAHRPDRMVHAGDNPGTASTRVIAKAVKNECEARDYFHELRDLGSTVIVQEWVGGLRESVNLFYSDGKIRGAIAQAAYRTTPMLGGVSVIRETIPLRDDLRSAAFALVEALDLEGYSEVEFRRDRYGRPLLMEINARLTAGIELAVRAGADFPLMLWEWAAGESVQSMAPYRTGVRMRLFSGDLEWLWENLKRRDRPDSVGRVRAAFIFGREFFQPQSYDYIDFGDLMPAVTAFSSGLADAGRRIVAKASSRSLTAKPSSSSLEIHA